MESFSGFLGFTRIEPQEFERLYSGIRYALNPRLVFFAYDEAGLPAGFLIAFPDISTALRAMKGRAGLVGRLASLWRRKQAKRITLYAGGLTPAEIAKRSGLARATFSAFLQNALEEGGEQLTIALMAKGGKARRWFSDEAPASRREYALYEWNP
jgi:hypothetical protein